MVAPAAAEDAVDGARKEVDTEALARAAQNPVADMVSIPFQDNIGFGYGPGNKGTQNVLNIQPVIPLHVTEDWNVITRTILPIVSQPSFTGGAGTTGLGDLTITAFLSPAKPGGVIWGVGPVASFPTATSPFTGSQSTWGLGPSAVALAMPGHWVLGVLVNQIWSVAGASASQMLIQYFVNYNFEGGWYLTTSPISGWSRSVPGAARSSGSASCPSTATSPPTTTRFDRTSDRSGRSACSSHCFCPPPSSSPRRPMPPSAPDLQV
jgi:hypothetical protein